MALPELIFDRTNEDADRWEYLSQKLDTLGWSALTAEEQQEWLSDLKGGYNCSDLNRVGTAVAFLGERFRDLILHLIQFRGIYGVASDPLFETPYVAEDVDIAPKIDWVISDNVYANQAARYLYDLSVIRSLIDLPSDTPAVPSDLYDLTLQEANDIEEMLYIVDVEITRLTDKLETWIQDTATAWFYSNDLMGGEI